MKMTKKKSAIGVAIVVAADRHMVGLETSTSRSGRDERVWFTELHAVERRERFTDNSLKAERQRLQSVLHSGATDEGIDGFAKLEVASTRTTLVQHHLIQNLHTLVLTWVTQVCYQQVDRTLCSRVLLHLRQTCSQNTAEVPHRNFSAEITHSDCTLTSLGATSVRQLDQS